MVKRRQGKGHVVARKRKVSTVVVALTGVRIKRLTAYFTIGLTVEGTDGAQSSVDWGCSLACALDQG